MAKQDNIRAKLQNKLFSRYGKTVILSALTAATYNIRGELENPSYTTSSIIIVPYSITGSRKAFTNVGDFDEAEFEAAVPYTVTITINDLISMEGTSYRVKEVQPNYLPDNVVTIIRLTKAQA